MSAQRIAALYMRGGASKGVVFHARDLPASGSARDALLLRLFGSPDPHGRQADGMGAATPETSNVVLVWPSRRDDCDVECLFGAVPVDSNRIDWSADGSQLVAAVGPFAVSQALVPAHEGVTRVRIGLADIGMRVDAYVPVRDGEVIEEGSFAQDGVPFGGAEIRLEWLAPADADAPLLPTGALQDRLVVPQAGPLPVTLVAASHPTVFLRAEVLGLTGRETPDKVNRDRRLLDRVEAIRAAAAAMMGLAGASARGVGPRGSALAVCWVARPASYRTSVGVDVAGESIDLLARMVANGRLHPSYPGAGSIALAAAAALPGTVVHEIARTLPGVPTRIGHVSGMLTVGAEVSQRPTGWRLDKAVLSSSARRLMSGWIHAPSAAVLSKP